jgi:hypothetical protein
VSRELQLLSWVGVLDEVVRLRRTVGSARNDAARDRAKEQLVDAQAELRSRVLLGSEALVVAS